MAVALVAALCGPIAQNAEPASAAGAPTKPKVKPKMSAGRQLSLSS